MERSSSQLNKELSDILPGSVHYNFNFPWDISWHHFNDWHGQFLTDIAGIKYMDFFSRFGANILWHKNIEYINPICSFFQENVSAVDHFGQIEIDTLNQLKTTVPIEDAQIRFSTSWTEAVLNTLRLARAYSRKQIIIRFHWHYHGNSDTILGWISSMEDWFIPKIFEWDLRWTQWRSSDPFADTLILPWNDIEAIEFALSKYDWNIAAVIMEPIAINGWGIMADLEYFQAIKDLSIKKKFLIIFDEIITGFRVNYGSVYNQTGIVPDIHIFWKWLAGWSFPISCFIGSSKIMSLYAKRDVTHGWTFNGYPLWLVAIKSTLDILSKTNSYDNAKFFAEKLRLLIEKSAKKAWIDIVVQGPSMAMVIHAMPSILNDLNKWTRDIKQKEELIRYAFAKENIILAPPCRIYPTIMFNEDAYNFVEERMDKVMENLTTFYNEKTRS